MVLCFLVCRTLRVVLQRTARTFWSRFCGTIPDCTRTPSSPATGSGANTVRLLCCIGPALCVCVCVCVCVCGCVLVVGVGVVVLLCVCWCVFLFGGVCDSQPPGERGHSPAIFNSRLSDLGGKNNALCMELQYIFPLSFCTGLAK